MRDKRLLLITLSNIGDLVMTTPLLEALNLAYPEHLIDVVADARSSELLRPCPYLGRLIHKEKRAGFGASWALLRNLRQYNYVAAVDLRTSFLTLLLRSGQRGVKRRGTAASAHAVEHHFTALRAILGADATIPAARLWLDRRSQKKAQHLLPNRVGQRVLAIAPGANWPGKIWPLECYQNLLRQLGDDFDHVVVLGAPDDRELGERLQRGAPRTATNLAGKTSLLEAAACMARASAFVGNDSGLGHMAAALGVPTVTVFGPGDPQRYRPWGQHTAVVMAPNLELPALRADVVAQALRELLARSKPVALAGEAHR